jgi:septum formation protein
MEKIILASRSPTRQKLAKIMGLDFDMVISNYVEDNSLRLPPHELAMELAFGKALDVSKRFSEGIVIGIDTFVYFNGKVIGKPKDRVGAFNMLKSFSGKCHEVYSGIAIIDCKTGKVIKDFGMTKVYFSEMSDSEINKYIETEEPLDKAGSYGIQDLGSIFIEKIEGDFFNVGGFPINNIYKNLVKMGVDIFECEAWKGGKLPKI